MRLKQNSMKMSGITRETHSHAAKQNEVKMFVITRETRSRAANAKFNENVRNKKSL